MIVNFFSYGRSYILFLWAIFLITIGLLIFHYSYFLNLFKKLDKKVILLLFLLLVYGLLLRIIVIPHRHHVYYDEFHFMHIAQNMHYHNISGYTLKGDKLHPEIVSTGDYRPGGYPFLLNLTFNLFGDSEKVVFNLNSFLGALSILLVFLLAYLLFDNTTVGLWSAFVFNLLPTHLKYSGSGASDISALFFVIFAILAVILYSKYKKISILYLSSSFILFASYIKPENAILFLFYIPILFIEFRNRRLIKKEVFNLLYFSIILLLPLFRQIPFIFAQEHLSAGGSFWSLKYFFINFADNIKYIFHFKYNIFSVSIFFLLGALILFLNKRRIFYFLVGWFFLFFVFYTCFFMGNFLPNKAGDSERHFFLCSLSFSILAGFGIYEFIRCFNKLRLTQAGFIFTIFILLNLNSLSVTDRLVNLIINTPEFKEYTFIKDSLKTLPENLYILNYHGDYIITAFNRKAIFLDIFFENKDFPKQLILLKGYWWYSHIDKSKNYENLLKNIYDFSLLQEIEIYPGLKYSFEKLVMKDK